MMKEDGRDLWPSSRRLAPEREPMKIQRWSVRRILLTIGVVLVAFIVLGLFVSNWAVFA